MSIERYIRTSPYSFSILIDSPSFQVRTLPQSSDDLDCCLISLFLFCIRQSCLHCPATSASIIPRPPRRPRVDPILIQPRDRVMHAFHFLHQRDDKELAEYRDTCTLKTCPIKASYFAYRPSLPTNALFLALFSLSLCCFILQAALSRRFIGFTVAMVSGCALEVLGYTGRIMSWYNPFNQVRLPSLIYQLLARSSSHPHADYRMLSSCRSYA